MNWLHAAWKTQQVFTEGLDADGDCYEAAWRLQQENPEYTLVHAEVSGQSTLEGVQFGHAYCVEKQILKGGQREHVFEIVHDYSNGRTIELPRDLYEQIGNVKGIGNVHEYDHEEATKTALRYGHYGPWDLETSSGL